MVSAPTSAFCVWITGGPPETADVVARAVVADLSHTHSVRILAPPSGSGEPADCDSLGRTAAELLDHGSVAVVVAAWPDEVARARARSMLHRLVEVSLGPAAVGHAELVVPADVAQAGFSAGRVLGLLAHLGWSDHLHDYNEEEEAQVSERLEALGYL